MKWISKAFSSVSGFFLFGVFIFGFCIHIKTIVIAYNVSGFFACFVTLMLPIISQIYWFIFAWSKAGFVNSYSVLVFAWVACLAIAGVSMLIAMKTEQDETVDLSY